MTTYPTCPRGSTRLSKAGASAREGLLMLGPPAPLFSRGEPIYGLAQARRRGVGHTGELPG
jgi:hypothetical protein